MSDLLLYDGHCRLCSGTARRLRTASGGTLELVSFRDIDVGRYGLSIEACEKAIHLVRAEGGLERGVLALAAALRRRWFGPLLSLVRLPLIRTVAEAVYALVSRWRFRLAGRTCEGTCSIDR
jgi:predicted DCC family thiol-disulfide oxidoreductase YuxK